jgi:hypothetical protein
MDYKILSDGSYDISARGLLLSGCYPGVNGRAIRAACVSISNDTIVYHMREASLRLSFASQTNAIVINAEYQGATVQTLHLIHRATVSGAESYYAQGAGTGGPCAHGKLSPEILGDQVAEGHSLIGIGNGEGRLMVFQEDASSYAQHSTLKYSHLPRQWNGWQTWSRKELQFDARFDLEDVARDTHSLSLTLLESGQSLAEGMKEAAGRIAVAMNARQSIAPLFHWCSWYEAYDLFSYDALEDVLAGIKARGVPFQYIQIDAGYATESGDWLTANHLWPGGLEQAFKSIAQAGYKPGIWIAPFLLSRYSDVVKLHPEWVLRGLDGRPVDALICLGERKQWHSRSETYWVLDTTHPGALDYLVSIFKALHGWGARLFKTDFISCGVWNSAAVRRFDASVTSAQALRSAMSVIRSVITDDSVLLGCIAPFAPMIGIADAMRIGGDVGAEWKSEGHGPYNMIRETQGAHYFNHIYWQNDPDALMLRAENTLLNDREVQALAIHQAVSGGAVNTSDRAHRLPEHRMEMLRFVAPDGIKRTPVYLDITDRYENLCIACHTLSHDRYLVWLFNAGERLIRVAESLDSLVHIKEGFVHKRGGGFTVEAVGTIQTDVKPHEGKLFFVSCDSPLTREPVNMWNWDEYGE